MDNPTVSPVVPPAPVQPTVTPSPLETPSMQQPLETPPPVPASVPAPVQIPDQGSKSKTPMIFMFIGIFALVIIVLAAVYFLAIRKSDSVVTPTPVPVIQATPVPSPTSTPVTSSNVDQSLGTTDSNLNGSINQVSTDLQNLDSLNANATQDNASNF